MKAPDPSQERLTLLELSRRRETMKFAEVAPLLEKLAEEFDRLGSEGAPRSPRMSEVIIRFAEGHAARWAGDPMSAWPEFSVKVSLESGTAEPQEAGLVQGFLQMCYRVLGGRGDGRRFVPIAEQDEPTNDALKLAFARMSAAKSARDIFRTLGGGTLTSAPGPEPTSGLETEVSSLRATLQRKEDAFRSVLDRTRVEAQRVEERALRKEAEANASKRQAAKKIRMAKVISLVAIALGGAGFVIAKWPERLPGIRAVYQARLDRGLRDLASRKEWRALLHELHDYAKKGFELDQSALEAAKAGLEGLSTELAADPRAFTSHYEREGKRVFVSTPQAAEERDVLANGLEALAKIESLAELDYPRRPAVLDRRMGMNQCAKLGRFALALDHLRALLSERPAGDPASGWQTEIGFLASAMERELAASPSKLLADLGVGGGSGPVSAFEILEKRLRPLDQSDIAEARRLAGMIRDALATKGNLTIPDLVRYFSHLVEGNAPGAREQAIALAGERLRPRMRAKEAPFPENLIQGRINLEKKQPGVMSLLQQVSDILEKSGWSTEREIAMLIAEIRSDHEVDKLDSEHYRKAGDAGDLEGDYWAAKALLANKDISMIREAVTRLERAKVAKESGLRNLAQGELARACLAEANLSSSTPEAAYRKLSEALVLGAALANSGPEAYTKSVLLTMKSAATRLCERLADASSRSAVTAAMPEDTLEKHCGDLLTLLVDRSRTLKDGDIFYEAFDLALAMREAKLSVNEAEWARLLGGAMPSEPAIARGWECAKAAALAMGFSLPLDQAAARRMFHRLRAERLSKRLEQVVESYARQLTPGPQ